jgi:hypothetical protein
LWSAAAILRRTGVTRLLGPLVSAGRAIPLVLLRRALVALIARRSRVHIRPGWRDRKTLRILLDALRPLDVHVLRRLRVAGGHALLPLLASRHRALVRILSPRCAARRVVLPASRTLDRNGRPGRGRPHFRRRFRGFDLGCFRLGLG